MELLLSARSLLAVAALGALTMRGGAARSLRSHPKAQICAFEMITKARFLGLLLRCGDSQSRVRCDALRYNQYEAG